MNTLFVFLTIFFLQASPHTKLIYELTGNFSGGQVTTVSLWQYYNDEGEMVLGGYEHKLKPQETIDSSLTTGPMSVDLDNDEIQRQLRENGLSEEQIRAIRSGPNIDSRTRFMREYQKAPEFFKTTADSVFDIRIGMEEKEALGFPKSMLQWKLQENIRDISGYQCQKATINYFGRTFTAWFTPEIPLNAGPYLFSGMPGTIVELTDDYGVYTYSLLEVVRSDPPEGIVFPESETIFSHQQAFRKQWLAAQRYISDLRKSDERIQRLLSQKTGVSINNTQSNSQPFIFNAHEHFFEWTILDNLLNE